MFPEKQMLQGYAPFQKNVMERGRDLFQKLEMICLITDNKGIGSFHRDILPAKQ